VAYQEYDNASPRNLNGTLGSAGSNAESFTLNTSPTPEPGLKLIASVMLLCLFSFVGFRRAKAAKQ
jgi:hypothetical protein